MRVCRVLLLGLGLFYAFTAAASPKSLIEPGDTVLTNCNGIYSKGQIKAKVDDGYTVHFPKNSGPLRCPPFRWHAEFVQPFQSVSGYRLQFFGGIKRDLWFKVGETVTFRLEADKRVVKDKSWVDIDAEITDISDRGAIAVKLLSSDPGAAATFWQWIGSNYVDLRHKSLDGEREKRANQ